MASASKPLNIIEEDSKHCTPCKTKNKKIESQYYCTDCEAYYCEDCFELHPRVPYLAKHIVLKHDDIAVWSKLQYKCTTHDKNLEFFCGEHKLLCCHVCVSLKHRSCVDMEYILESAKNICAKDEIRMMLQRTQTELETIDLYEETFEMKAERNQHSKSECVKDLEEYTSKLKKAVDLLKTKALDEVTEKFEANKKYSDKMVEKLKKFKRDLQDLKHQLTTATVEKEALIFISLKRGGNTVEDVKRELSEMDACTNKEKFNFEFDSEIESYVRNIEKIASVEDEKMKQELVSSEDYDNVVIETPNKRNEKGNEAKCNYGYASNREKEKSPKDSKTKGDSTWKQIKCDTDCKSAEKTEQSYETESVKDKNCGAEHSNKDSCRDWTSLKNVSYEPKIMEQVEEEKHEIQRSNMDREFSISRNRKTFRRTESYRSKMFREN